MRTLLILVASVCFATPPSTRDPLSSGFTVQQLPNIGTIREENGVAVKTVDWGSLDASCSKGGTISVRRTNETGARSVQKISVVVQCDNQRHHLDLDGFIEGVDLVIPPR